MMPILKFFYYSRFSDKRNTVAKVENYKDACYTGQTKQTVGVLVFSVKNVLNAHCKNVNSRKSKDLISATPCLNEGLDDTKKCLDVAVRYLQAVEKFNDQSKSQQKLGQLCCAYSDFIKCAQTNLSKHKNCNEKSINTMVGFLKQILDPMIDLICGKFSGDTDACDNFQYTPASPTLKYHSFAAPAIHIISSL